MTLEAGETILPASLGADQGLVPRYVACVSGTDKLLVFPLAEVKELAKGRGVILMGLAGDSLKHLCVFEDGLTVTGVRRGRTIIEAPRFELSKRARKGVQLNLKVDALDMGGKKDKC